MLSKYGYTKLRGYIKANSAASMQLSKDIATVKKRKKNDHQRIQPLRDLKDNFSQEQRHHLIAYGLLRGIPYKVIEPCCGNYNNPNIAEVHKIIERYTIWKDWQLWTLDHVCKLINGESK